MKTSNRPRPSTAISRSRWIAYGLAGAATAVGATTAEAEIHYSGVVNVEVSFGTETFALSNGALLWFNHYQTTTNYTKARFQVLDAAVSNGWQSDQSSHGRAVPEKLRRKQLVSAQNFGSGVGVLASTGFGTHQGAEFDSAGYGYVGFKFNTGAGTQYGWARLKMRGNHRTPFNAFDVIDYAWGDPGEHIRAGQTSRSPQEQAAVSPAGSLGLLALGKAGRELWRSERLASVAGK